MWGTQQNRLHNIKLDHVSDHSVPFNNLNHRIQWLIRLSESGEIDVLPLVQKGFIWFYLQYTRTQTMQKERERWVWALVTDCHRVAMTLQGKQGCVDHLLGREFMKCGLGNVGIKIRRSWMECYKQIFSRYLTYWGTASHRNDRLRHFGRLRFVVQPA